MLSKRRIYMASWIWTADKDSENQWVCFRKNITLESVPAHAAAEIAVNSKYWLWINGELLVREGGLKRGPTPNDTYCDMVDITPFLKVGENSIAALVWYFGRNSGSHRSSGCPGFYFNEPICNIQSDACWKAFPHPAFLETDSAIFNGFRILPEWNILFDASKVIGTWTTTLNGEWEDAIELGEPPCAPWHSLVPRPTPMWLDSELLSYEIVEPQTKSPLTENTVITARMGANVQCYPYFKIRARGGERIEFHAERDWRKNEYIAKSGVQEFECPAWGNGHYVSYSFPKGVEIIELKYRKTGYNTKETDRFRPTHPEMRALWDKCVRSSYINMRDSFTDCPDRERMQWPGDAASILEQALYAFDESSHALIRKFFRETVAWRSPDGVLWGPIPTDRFRGSYREFPVQMFAVINSAAIYYRHTKDSALIEEILPHIEKYLLDVWQVDPEELLIHRGSWQTNWLDGPQGWYDWGENIDKRLLENAFYYIALDALCFLSDAVGNEETNKRALKVKALFSATFDKLFWDGSAYRSPNHEGTPDDRGNALAVYGGLADRSKWDALEKLFESEEHASIYMEKYVIEVLCLMEKFPLAVKRMKKRLDFEISSDWSTIGENYGDRSNHGWGAWPIVVFSKYPKIIEELWDKY